MAESRPEKKLSPQNSLLIEPHSVAESARARRGAHCARVRVRRALDVGCAPARGGIVRIVHELHEAASQALDLRLDAVQGWIFDVRNAPTA